MPLCCHEIEVVALQVEEPELVLAEAVERLVGLRDPLLPHVLRVLAHHDRRHDGAAALFLFEDRRAGRVEERHPARAEVDARAELGGGERRRAGLLGHVPLRAVAALRRRRQALAGEEGLVLGVGDADHVGRADLQLQQAVADVNDEAVRHPLDVAARGHRVGEGRPARGGVCGAGNEQHEEPGDAHGGRPPRRRAAIFPRGRWAWLAQLPHIPRAHRGEAGTLARPMRRRASSLALTPALALVGAAPSFPAGSAHRGRPRRRQHRRPRRLGETARAASARLRRPALRHVPSLRDPHVHRLVVEAEPRHQAVQPDRSRSRPVGRRRGRRAR